MKSISIFTTTAVTSALFIAGCASIGTQFTKMSEPEAGERARIRIHANMLVKGIPNSNCIDWSKEGAGTIFGGIVGSNGYRGRSLNMPNPDGITKNSGEFYATANQPIVLSLLNTPESWMRCAISGSFIPKAGKDYQIDLSTNKKDRKTSICKMRIREITSSGWSAVPLQSPVPACQ